MDRRLANRRTSTGTPPDLIVDQRSMVRRCQLRRRGDANSVEQMLSTAESGVATAFELGALRARKGALYACGCAVVDPISPTQRLQVLECPTHAALQVKLRRRRTDRE